MGANSRQKGAAFERDVANYLNTELGTSLRRNLTQYQINDLGDLITDDPSWPFTIECKAEAKVSTKPRPAWWHQVTLAADKAGKAPVLIYKYTGYPVRVVMRARDAFDAADADFTVEVDMDAFVYLAREAWQ